MKNTTKISIIAIIAVILDQIIKFIITSNLKVVETIHVIKNFFGITYVQNTGAAFSIFNDSKILLILLSILILIVLVYYITKKNTLKNFEIITYGVLFGGILGNLIDRIRLGYVIDYLDFNFGSYNYPIFNLADIFIVISGIIVMIKLMKED